MHWVWFCNPVICPVQTHQSWIITEEEAVNMKITNSDVYAAKLLIIS